MLIRLREPLREADKKEGSDGGGGADDPPKYLTEEQFGEAFNRAFTSKWRTLEKQNQAATEKLTTDLLSKLDERLGQLKPQDPPADKPPADEFKKQLEDMASKLEASEARFRDSESKRAEVERQRQYDAARSALTSGLKDKAHPDYLEDWVNRVAVGLNIGDDGSATLRTKHIPFRGSPEVEEDLTLDQAIPKLLERAEYKKYQAAPAPPENKGGRAPRATGNGSQRLNPDNPLDRVNARLAELGMSFDQEFGGGDS